VSYFIFCFIKLNLYFQGASTVKPVGKQQPEAKKPKQESKEKKTVAEKEKEKEEEEVEEEDEKEGKKKLKGHCIKECELLIFEIYRLLGGSVCGCKQ
jgi:hypothetical protein